jgi:hypothetical protein
MSAIDNTFHFVRNPTAINGLATTYVSKRGNDTTGDGTAQNPYASIAKATSVATIDTNIMLDDGRWSEQRTLNNRKFIWWGNTKTRIDASFVQMTMYANDKFYDIEFFSFTNGSFIYCVDCILIGLLYSYPSSLNLDRCIAINSTIGTYKSTYGINNSVLINSTGVGSNTVVNSTFYNNIVIGINCLPTNGYVDYNNYTTLSIPTGNSINSHSINDASTGQTVADYFNKYDANDWLKCDFTAKEGSKNIGAGEKGTTIGGLNRGYTMYADNSANDMFKQGTLKNVEWNSTLNGYTLIQKERVCAGATASTIILDSSASSVDDYYNNLFVGIVAGDGYGEIFKITDYDGGTKTATIDGSWNTTPNTNSIYTISGTIFSATKDFGKAIKVKRNWTFADSFTALQDGRWAEFLTNLTSQGKELPVNCFLYEYSVDGTNWVQGHTSDDLVSAINGENKVMQKIYGDCSQNYDEATARNLVIRYIRVNVHIGFNI